MTGKDLLLVLGDVNQKYYEEAEKQPFPGAAGFRGRRRAVLIAAVIALSLLLVGCAVGYALRLSELAIGRETLSRTDGTEEDPTSVTEVALEVFSLQGIRNSTNYLANREWLEFTQSYVPELGDYWESDEAYWAYSVQNQVMVEEIDEICARYGLKVIGKPWHEHQDCREFLSLVGVRDLLRPGSEAQLHLPRGRFFAGGSFNVYGTLTMPQGDSLTISFGCIQKDVFYDVFGYVDPNSVTERQYTTEQGIPLLLLEGENSGMILADREGDFLSVSVGHSSHSTLEQVAEQFDFTFQTKAMDPAAADAREQASLEALAANDPYRDRFRRATYGEYIADLLESDAEKLAMGFAPEEIPQREYAFRDLDGDGTQELLVVVDGRICTVVGWRDGKTDEGKSYGMVLCQENILIERNEYSDGEIWYHIFYFANDGDPVFSNPKEQSILRLKDDNGTWWRTSSTDHYADFDTRITEEEAMEILNAYTPVQLDTKPLSEFEEP